MSTETTTQNDGQSEHASTTDPETFESALAELEALVTDMESGDLTLDESLKAFERGVGLARRCQVELKQAEQKVQILNAEGKFDDYDGE